jgi:hypothetical protein
VNAFRWLAHPVDPPRSNLAAAFASAKALSPG